MTDNLVYVIAGEMSGDLLGARLVTAMRGMSQRPLAFAGIGGSAMQAAGVPSLFPIRDLSVMGLAEVLPRLPKLLARIGQATRDIIARLRERFPSIIGPRTDDICYATTNRQAAVRELAPHCDLVLVLGSQNSSNSKRLVEVAKENGAASYLIDGATEVEDAWLEGVSTIGITSGASAPEELVERLVAFLQERGAPEPEDFEVLREDVRFMLPKEIRKGLAA